MYVVVVDIPVVAEYRTDTPILQVGLIYLAGESEGLVIKRVFGSAPLRLNAKPVDALRGIQLIGGLQGWFRLIQPVPQRLGILKSIVGLNIVEVTGPILNFIVIGSKHAVIVVRITHDPGDGSADGEIGQRWLVAEIEHRRCRTY